MDINLVLDKFSGKNFILYGGDQELMKSIQEKGNILLWYTLKYDESSTPPQQFFDKFLLNIEEALKDTSGASEFRESIIIIVGSGYVSGTRCELIVPRILRYTGYNSHTLILHGYPEYVTSKGIAKQEYTNGCIVALEDERVTALQELIRVCYPQLTIPIPLRDSDLLPGSEFFEQIKGVLPYIHLISRIRDSKEETGRIRLPITDDTPIDILDLSNREKQREYDAGEMTSAIHWGQRKLLLSEIELLTEVLKSNNRYIVVYVGAAPGSHIPYLMSLFLNKVDIRIHLWDRPSRFDVKEDITVSEDRRIIRIVPSEFSDPLMTGDKEGFFTDVVAQKYYDAYGRDNNLIFISDIRDEATEEAVDADMKMQRRWIEKIQPYVSYVKFRLPFINDTYEYLDGQIHTQAWSRMKSTETRLLSYRPYHSRIYDVKLYDRQMSYFNMITRMSSYDIGKIVGLPSLGRSLSLPDQGFCTCHDCAREAQIITKYMKYLNITPTESILSRFISANTDASRPRDDPTNRRTLWNNVLPRVPISERKNVILFQSLPENMQQFEDEINQLWRERCIIFDIPVSEIVISDKPIHSIDIRTTSLLFIYGDGYSATQIVQLLLQKKQGKIYIEEMRSPILSLKQVINGKRPISIVNFHTDFVKNYDPSRDRGNTPFYNLFIQGLDIRRQKNPKVDVYEQYLLYLLTHIHE